MPTTLVLAVMTLLAGEAFGQDAKPAARPARKPNPALAPIQDEPGLPRVLLVGDSISIGYTLPVRELLKGKANVHRIPTNGGDTTRGVDNLDQWLGKGRWDVIHFNWGLHDLKIIDGKFQDPLDKYEANLSKIVARLKQTGAKLIWCSTTPVPASPTGPGRKNSDVEAYNVAAKKIMEQNGIAIDDLYSFAEPQISNIQIPNNVHFTPEGSKVLAEQVAASISQALALK